MIICVIPCRAKSKRLPGKNSKLFNGKPLVEWTLEQARQLEFVDKIILTTDDITLSKYPEYEARSSVLAGDDVPIQETLDRIWVKHKPEVMIMLQVTTPQRTVGNILTAFTLFHDSPFYNSLVSINPNNQPNGAIFMTRTGHLYAPKILLFKSKSYLIDIDYEYQFRIAEALCK